MTETTHELETVQLLRRIEEDAFEALRLVDAIRTLSGAECLDKIEPEHVAVLLRPVHDHLSAIMARFDEPAITRVLAA